MVSTTTSQLNTRMDARLRAAGKECEQVLSAFVDKEKPAGPSRGDEFIAQIDGWHSEQVALAKSSVAPYVAPTDEELDEMLYDEWLADDGWGLRCPDA